MQFLIVERFLKKSEVTGKLAQCGGWLYFAVQKEFWTLKFCSPWPNVLIVDDSTQTAACNLVHFCCSDLKMEQIQLLNVEKEYPLLLLCSLLFFLGSIYPPLFLRNLRIKVRAGFLSRSLQDRRYVAGITLCNCDCLCASPTLASNLKVSIFVKSYGKLTAVIFISSTIKYEQETLYFV